MNASLVDNKLRLDFTENETKELKNLFVPVVSPPPPPPVVVNPPPVTTSQGFKWFQTTENQITGRWNPIPNTVKYILRVRIGD